MGVNFVDRVEAGLCRPADKQIAFGAECQMISGGSRLQGSESKNLAITADLKDRAAAIADIHILFAIKRYSGCYSHTLSVSRDGAVRRNPIHRTVVPG